MILIINNKEVDLPDNLSVKYVMSSTVFNPLQGSYSYPITLKATERNEAILNYPNVPNIAGNPRQEQDFQLWIGNFLIEGTVKIQSSTRKTITINLEVMPGNTPKNLWRNKLNVLDFGGETIPTITATSNYNFRILWADMDLHLMAQYTVGHTVRLYFDDSADAFIGTPVFNYQFGSDISIDMPVYRQLFIDRINKLTPTHIIISADETGISLQTTSAATKATLKFFTMGGGQITHFDMSHIGYTTIQQNYYDSKINNAIYALPAFQNFKFYRTQADWQGIINLKVDNQIQLNQDGFANRNTVIPQLKFPWVIAKIGELLGYTPEGDFLLDTSIQKMLIINLFGTDAQSSSTTLPFNVHSAIIKYANHLPALTLSEFLQALIDQFAIGLQFNSLTKKMEFFYFKNILDSSDILDLTGRISFEYSSELQDLKKKQLKFATGSDEMVTDTEEIFQASPLDSEIVAIKDQYTSVDLKFPSLAKLSGQLSEIETEGISVLYNQTTNENPLRLAFLENGQLSSSTSSLSLALRGTNNLIDTLHTKKLALENNYVPLKAKALLSPQELFGFSFKTKILAYNVLYLVEQLSASITKQSEKIEVEFIMRRINIT